MSSMESVDQPDAIEAILTQFKNGQQMFDYIEPEWFVMCLN